ncbi:MAG: TonB-dependent receptor [Flavobacteriaceae bacterium]|nr:TonB-dependent receptor [Flavobacteriaceae bacterium]
MKRFFTTIIFTLTGLLTAQTGEVYGVVTDWQGLEIEAVKIEIKKGKVLLYTDSEGKYSISLPAGKYEMDINSSHMFKQRETIEIIAGERKEFNILLDDKVQLNGIELFGEISHQPEKLDQITRLPLKPNENIQTITTISKKVIEKQGILTISEAVRNAPGLYTYATYGNRSESIGGRGFRGLPVLKNGVRVHSDFRGQGFLTDMQGVESVQIIKGAATISQGFGLDLGSTGGVVNLVTKFPRFYNFGEVSLRYGSWNQIRPTLDINRVLDKKKTLAFRLNGAYEHKDGYRQNNSNNRYYINPSLHWHPNDKWDVKFEMDYLDDKRTPDPGTVNLSQDNTTNLTYDLPKKKFLGFESNYVNSKILTYSITGRYDINQNLYVRAGFYGALLDSDGETSTLNQISDENGFIENPNIVNRSLTRTPYRIDNNKVAQLDLILHEIKTGNFKHLVQIGADFRNTHVETKSFNTLNMDQINIFDAYISNQLPHHADFNETGNSDQKVDQFGGLFQYVIEYQKWLRFYTGLRYSNYKDNAVNGRWNRNSGEMEFSEDQTKGHVLNPLLGLMVYPIQNIGVFASYTSNTNPRNAANLDFEGNQLGNERADQFEIGFKSEWFQNRLRINTTYFRVQNKNMIMQDVGLNEEGNLEFLPWYIKGGDDIRQGVEFELIGRVSNQWEFMAGFSRLYANYQNSTRFVDGSRPNNTPKNVANLWSNYIFDDGFLKGVNIGAGIYHLGARPYNDYVFTAYHGITPGLVPWENKAYTTLNAQIGYSRESFGIKLFLNNLWDEIGYNAYRNQYINRIDPRNFAVQINYKF